MSYEIDIQRVIDADHLPSDQEFRIWVEAVLKPRLPAAELVIRIVSEQESQALNLEYRGKDCPTNVLSFPFETPDVVETDLLGDLVICAPVVVQEALDQGKSLDAHWAHMVVHGLMHLLGFDHQNDEQAAEMEHLEVEILTGLGFPDPYADPSDVERTT
ncbi:MAG: rRNA maturation RNase YbeY [Sedimenticola sp.]|nr:MAG: rRNA maturation RNase YbeY [Sedimenticola sp.]